MELVARWAPIGLADALELLSPAFTNPEVCKRALCSVAHRLLLLFASTVLSCDGLQSLPISSLPGGSQSSTSAAPDNTKRYTQAAHTKTAIKKRAPCKPSGRKLSAHGADRVPQQAPHRSQKGLGRSEGSSAAVTNLGLQCSGIHRQAALHAAASLNPASSKRPTSGHPEASYFTAPKALCHALREWNAAGQRADAFFRVHCLVRALHVCAAVAAAAARSAPGNDAACPCISAGACDGGDCMPAAQRPWTSASRSVHQ